MAQVYRRFIISVLMVAAFITQETYARSGCALFGHSCYGGIGKRADAAVETIRNVEDGHRRPQEVNELLQSLSDNGPSTGGDVAATSPERTQVLDRYVRQWVIDYLRTEDAYERK